MIVKKFQAAHLIWLMEQPRHEHLKKHVHIEGLSVMEKADHVYTVLADDGRKILACGGLTFYWENRAEAWAILNKDVKQNFPSVHRAAKELLECAPFRRVEAAVEVRCKFSHRWVKALGFKMEAPLLKSYLPGGTDCALYARVS